jgi:hypothetical protein
MEIAVDWFNSPSRHRLRVIHCGARVDAPPTSSSVIDGSPLIIDDQTRITIRDSPSHTISSSETTTGASASVASVKVPDETTWVNNIVGSCIRGYDDIVTNMVNTYISVSRKIYMDGLMSS